MENVKGIDISKWQGVIDFNKVKADGIQFAILREGFRRAIDGNFIEYVRGMKAAGIQILGVYHFIYIDGATPAQNAIACVNNLKTAGLDPVTTWIFADLEYDTWDKAGVKVTKALCTQYTKEFLETLKSSGCKRLGIYCNPDYYKNYYDWNQLSEYRKYLWLADWYGGPDVECMVHQYSDSTKVNGINGNVDGNYLVDANAAGFVVYSTEETKSEVNYMTENELRQKPAESNKTEVRASNYANYFDRRLAGTYKTTADLHCRDGAGTSHKSLVVIPDGTEAQCYGYYNVVSGTRWLYIQFTLKGVKYAGFSSSKYLKRK